MDLPDGIPRRAVVSRAIPGGPCNLCASLPEAPRQVPKVMWIAGRRAATDARRAASPLSGRNVPEQTVGWWSMIYDLCGCSLR
jgi:hypothetical protein